MKEALRAMIKAHARLDVPIDTLGDDVDLYAHGLSSLAVVNMLLAIEDEFEIEFPDAELNRNLFRSVNSLAEKVAQFRNGKATA